MLGVPSSNPGSLSSDLSDLLSESEVLTNCLFVGVSRIPKELCLPDERVILLLLPRGLFFGVANRLEALDL